MTKRLTPDAEHDRFEWEQLMHGVGCTCFRSPPCSTCMHPGNPINQEIDECWEEDTYDIAAACAEAMERIRKYIGAL